MLLTIVITISALFAYLLNYVVDKSKHKKAFSRIVTIAVVLTLATIWGNYFHQQAEFDRRGREFEVTEEGLKRIRVQNDSLKAQINEMWGQSDLFMAQIDELSQNLESYLQRARVGPPALGDEEARGELAREFSKTLGGIQDKIIPLPDKTKSWKDSDPNLIYTVYYFRSQYPITARDISIRIKFETTLVHARGRITGAVVVEQGSRMVIDGDSKGFTFMTGLLRVGNEIMIEVVGNKPLEITSMQLSP